MKILLVRPQQSNETIGLQFVMVVDPLELEILAACVDPSDDVKIVDMILEKKDIYHQIRSYKPDVVGVTGYITNIPQMIEYARAAKSINPGIKTVVGGVHIEKFPEEAEHDAIDFRVIRNATRTFPLLLEHIKGRCEKPKGALGKNEKQDRASLPPFDFYYPRPRRDLVEKYKNKYFYVFHNKVALIKTSFGCPYKCDFCFCRFITDDTYYARPIPEVLDELESISQKEIYIIDDDFLVGRKRMEEFLQGLRDRNIRKNYLVYGRADFIANNPDIIRDFKKLGLRTVIVGLESFTESELYSFNKQSSVSINEQCMNVLNTHKVDCYAAMIVSPDWGQEQFDMTIKKLIELEVKFVNLQPLTPLPGTGLNIPEDRVIIDRKDYPKWDMAHVSIIPDKMSLEDFYYNIIRAYDKVILHPKFVLSHLRHSPWQVYKIIGGAMHVRGQYFKKYKESLKAAKNVMKAKGIPPTV